MAEDLGTMWYNVRGRTDELDRDLGRAEQKVREVDRRIEQNTGKGFGGQLVEGFFRAVAAAGTLELALKGANAVGEALAGNFEKSAELIKQMPAGIGPLAQAMEDVLAKVIGVADQIERARVLGEAGTIATSLLQQRALVLRGATPQDALEAQSRSREAPLQKQLSDLNNIQTQIQNDIRDKDQAFAPLQTFLEAIRLRADREEMEGELADVSVKIKAFSDAIEASRALLEAQTEQLQKQQAAETQAIETQIKATQLRQQGLEVEAKIVEIREKARLDIEKAEQSGNQPLANALRRLRDLDIAGLRGGDDVGQQFAREFNIANRGTANGALALQPPGREPATERTAARQTQLLQNIANVLVRNRGNAVFN